MKETNEKVLDLIIQNNTLNKIAEELNMSNRQVHLRILNLIRRGYQIKANYYDTGEIKYDLVKELIEPEKDLIKINTPSKKDNIKIMVISDTHYGNKFANYNYIYRIYEYCIKNDINAIINTGDFIEGLKYNNDFNYKNSYEAIKNILTKYPYEKNIINYILLGNHDYHALKMEGININHILNTSRPDLVSLGYGNAQIGLKEETIRLVHSIKELKHKNVNINDKIVLIGHSHNLRMQFIDKAVIHTPPLSNVIPYEYKGDVVPGALEIDLTFERECFKNIYIKHLLVEPKVMLANEMEYHFKQKTLSKTEVNMNFKNIKYR